MLAKCLVWPLWGWLPGGPPSQFFLDKNWRGHGMGKDLLLPTCGYFGRYVGRGDHLGKKDVKFVETYRHAFLVIGRFE